MAANVYRIVYNSATKIDQAINIIATTPVAAVAALKLYEPAYTSVVTVTEIADNCHVGAGVSAAA